MNEAQLFMVVIPSVGLVGLIAVRVLVLIQNHPKLVERRAIRDQEHLEKIRDDAFNQNMKVSLNKETGN